MRLDDLYSYKSASALEEGIGDTIMSKLGSQEAKGRVQSQKQAKELVKKFKYFVGQAGHRGKTGVPPKLLASFLSQNKLPNDGVENLSVITPKDAQELILKAVQNKASGMGGSTNNEPQVNPEPKQQPMVDPVHSKQQPAGNSETFQQLQSLDDKSRKNLIKALGKL